MSVSENPTGDDRRDDRVTPRLIMSVASAGILSFCGVVIETAMNVSFPALMNEFGAGTSTVQWITSGYLLMLAIIMPTSSWLSGRFRIRQLFFVAIAFFMAGLILCAASPTFAVLLLGRFLQGVGTGIALPLMYNIVLTQAPLPSRGVMMGASSLIPAAAPAVGPSLGGFIIQYLGWRMIFVMLSPFIVLSFILGFTCHRNNPLTEEGRMARFDFPGWLLLAVSFTCLITMLSHVGTTAFLSFQVAGLLVISLAALAAFIAHDLRREKNGGSPLIHLPVFRVRRFVCALIAFVFLQFICLGIGFIIPNFAQIVLGAKALPAGCILLPGCILGAVLAPVSGRLYDLQGPVRPLLSGAVSVCVAVLLFSLYLSRTSTTPVLTLIYVVFAFGQTMDVANGLTNGLSALPRETSADGNAVFNTLQQLFGALGTAVCSSIVAARQADLGLEDGMVNGGRTAFLVLLAMALVMLCAMVVSLIDARRCA